MSSAPTLTTPERAPPAAVGTEAHDAPEQEARYNAAKRAVHRAVHAAPLPSIQSRIDAAHEAMIDAADAAVADASGIFQN